MKKNIKHITLTFAIIFSIFNLHAQRPTNKTCGSDDYYNRQLAANSNFVKNQKIIENLTKSFIHKGGSKQLSQSAISTPIVTIPVVVHVLWNQPHEKISIAQIQSQIEVLNKDFQLLNSDRVNTPAPFQPFQADCQIAFCMATRDPNGQSTNGVVYKQTGNTWFWEVTDDAMFSSQGGDDIWDRDSYLNIWVVPGLKNILFSNIAGYAHFPGGNAATDGLVIQHNEFGTIETAYDLGRTATHEVGHWLNLKHIWGLMLPVLDCLDSDNVDDTPNQEGPNNNCESFPHFSCNSQPYGDMFMNFMDYSDDNCMNLFTLGQKDRMLALFQPSGPRFSLLSSLACSGVPDLTILNPAISPTSVNPGDNVTVSFIEENSGYASAGPNYINFHLSADDILTPGLNGDIYLDQYFVSQTLAPISQTSLLSKQITIPSAVESGTYYVFFAADGTSLVNEGNESNNLATSIITISGACPDLVVIDQSASPITVTAGNNTIVEFKERNNGNANAGPNYVSFHLSANNILTPGQNGDIYLDEHYVNQTLLPLTQTTSLTKQITIPSSVNSGTYYLFFSADGGATINECDNLNNFATVILNISGVQSTQAAYKYWFDGNSTSHVTVSGSFGNNYTIQSNIPTSSLQPGLHTFSIGFKDVNQKWSSVVSSFFYKNNINTPAGYSKYEYWVDHFFTTRTIRNINETSSLILLDNFNTNILNTGLHIFNIRFKPDAKHWSSISSSFFYKPKQFPAGTSQYELWVDNDYINKITTNVNNSNSLILLDSLNTNNLNNGLHSFNIRFKPDGIHWSSIISSFFYKPKEILTGLAQYEYWFDNDYANKDTVSISSTNNFQLLDNLSSNNLNHGLHTFNIRFKPDGKQWSSVVSSFFYKTPATLTGTPKYQYWFDNKTQDSVTVVVGSTNNLILLDSLINAQPVGLHTLNIRFKPDGGLWSSVTSSFFYRNPTTNIINNTIAHCAYWYDNNWQNPNLVYYSGQQNLSSIINTDAEELSIGMHKVSMMFRDERGSWSSVVSDSFNRTVITSPVCPFNNKLFRADVFLSNNAIRQWQVDTGTEFVNLANNANYTGINSDTLQIIGAPTSWYGYKYRCVLTDGNTTLNSSTYTLKFYLIWNGTTDTGWENPANWSCNSLPDGNTDVFINPGVTNFPEINTNGICRSLTAKPGVNVVVKTGASFIIAH